MSKSKSPDEERAIILEQPAKRPYGARVRVHVQTAASLGRMEGESISLSTGALVTIAPARQAPWEGGKKYAFSLEGFATAAAAECAGRQLTQSLLWTAVSLDFALRLEYGGYEPAAVFERNRSEGMRDEAYGEVGWQKETVVREIKEAYAHLGEPDPRILLSMEIFAAARIESRQRARFLAVVSALEPLAKSEALGPEVDAFVGGCNQLLRDNAAVSCEIRRSLQGRLGSLSKESIRQALGRVVRTTLPDRPDAFEIVDRAYELRSQIIHDGRPGDPDVDLEQEARDVSHVVRAFYASKLGRTLVASAAG